MTCSKLCNLSFSFRGLMENHISPQLARERPESMQAKCLAPDVTHRKYSKCTPHCRYLARDIWQGRGSRHHMEQRGEIRRRMAVQACVLKRNSKQRWCDGGRGEGGGGSGWEEAPTPATATLPFSCRFTAPGGTPCSFLPRYLKSEGCVNQPK